MGVCRCVRAGARACVHVCVRGVSGYTTRGRRKRRLWGASLWANDGKRRTYARNEGMGVHEEPIREIDRQKESEGKREKKRRERESYRKRERKKEEFRPPSPSSSLPR